MTIDVSTASNRNSIGNVEITAIVDEGLGNSAYLIGLGDGSALVIDPERDPRAYVKASSNRMLTVRVVLETHLHADFVSGGQELAALGAELWAPAASDLSSPHRPLRDNDELDLGSLTLRAIATPGHTPEHMSYLLLDGSRPLALFSGGTLITGGVARTDLLADSQTELLARAAYRSVKERIFTLPDGLVIYPTHGTGSFCSIGSSSERTTTVGREKSSNPLFADESDEDTFIERLVAGYGSYPPYFRELREVNRRGPSVHGINQAPLPALSPDQVEHAMNDGAMVVDSRGIGSFADGHIPGSLSDSWRPHFATWLGWLAELSRPLVFVLDEDVDRQDVMWACRTVGFDILVGELEGGIESWIDSGRCTARVPFTTAVDDRKVVDVRQRSEFESGHLVGALNIDLGDLSTSFDLVPDGPLLLHCARGLRAMSAASILLRAGFDDVAVLDGQPEDIGPVVVDPGR